MLILATKPDQVPAALAEISGAFTKNHLLISIAAGVTLSKLETALPAGARVIRVMPNTPALVGESASAFALGKAATAADALRQNGHGVILHSTSVGDNSLIGMGSTLLNRSRIGKNCIIGANALVTEAASVTSHA